MVLFMCKIYDEWKCIMEIKIKPLHKAMLIKTFFVLRLMLKWKLRAIHSIGKVLNLSLNRTIDKNDVIPFILHES